MTATLNRPTPVPPAPPPAPRRFTIAEPEYVKAAWFAALAAFVLCAGAGLSLNGVIQGYSWLPQLLLTLFITLGAAALARTLGARSLWGSVAAAIGLVISQTFLFFSNTALLGIIPTGRTITGVRLVAVDLQDQIMSQIAPLSPTGPAVFMLSLGAGVVALCIEFLAFGLRLPAVAGIPPAILLAVASLFKPDGAGLLFLLAAAAGYLLVLAAGRRMESALTRRRFTQETTATGTLHGGSAPQGALLIVAALATMLLVPLALPGFATGALPQGQRLHLFGSPTGVNPLISLGNNLRDGSETTSLTYYTDSTVPLYLRTSVVGNLETEQWKPTEITERETFAGELTFDAGAIMVPLENPTTTEIRTGTYNSPWLPLPNDARLLSNLRGNWSWAQDTSTLLAERGTSTSAQQYTATSAGPVIDPEQMRTLGQLNSGGFGVPREYLAMPAQVPRSVVETARTAVDAEQASTPFDQAVALQDYLRGGSFSYSEQTPLENGYDGSGVAVVEAFLEQRSGYCVHFASSMALMARSLGIPSRIVTGYAPGRTNGSSITADNGTELTGYALSSRSAHAWPELYFEGVGWVPFEPTPGRGRTPTYAPSADESGPSQPSTPETDPTRAPNPTPSSTPSPVPPGQVDSGAGQDPGAGNAAQLPWQLLLVPGLALIGLLPRLVRSLVRRRRLAAGTPVAAWAELVALGEDYALPMNGSESAAGYARRLAALHPEATPGLDALRAAFERETYAPAGAADAHTESRDDALRAVHATLHADADARTRFLAGFAPRSLFGSRPGAPTSGTAERGTHSG